MLLVLVFPVLSQIILGGDPFKKPYVIEIIVESKDAESVSPGILPYNQIFGIFQSKFLNLPGSGVNILNP